MVQKANFPTFMGNSLVILAASHRATQIAALRSALSQRKPKSQESCHAVSPNRTQRSFKSPHRRNSSKWSQIAKKNSPEKHPNFFVFQKTAVKMKTKTGLGKVRGTKSHFTYPCKNHIKTCQKTQKWFFTFLVSFHQITVKTKQICNKNTHLRNALWNEILSKPCENSMVCGIHLFANALPKPFGEQHCPKTQHAKASASKRACVPRKVPACLKMSLPAPKL